VPQFFAQASWLRRLQFAADVAIIYAQWRQHFALPVGLHGGRLVACYVAGRWRAHLIPCPRVPESSAYHLLQADLNVLAGIAPENVRGASAAGAPEDVFAAGALVLLALGFRPEPGYPPAEYLERQACSQLLSTRFGGNAQEEALRQIPSAQKRLVHLENTARQCTCFEPLARPLDLRELCSACEQVLAFSVPASCAAEMDANGQTSDALRFLEWSFAAGTEDEESRRIAATLAAKLGSPVKQLQHLDAVLRFAPYDYETARRRWRLRYVAFLSKDQDSPQICKAEGDWLLAELERLRGVSTFRDDDDKNAAMKDDLLCTAMIHERRGDLYARAAALYELTKLGYVDMESLFLYGLALREMADQKDATGDYRAKVIASLHKLFDTASERLNKLLEAGRLNEEEVKEWTGRFQYLLPS
jgi:hypothetical protein